MAFESKETKTKKQMKKELEEFPTLEGQAEFMQEQRMKDFKQAPVVQQKKSLFDEEEEVKASESKAGGKKGKKGGGKGKQVADS